MKYVCLPNIEGEFNAMQDLAFTEKDGAICSSATTGYFIVQSNVVNKFKNFVYDFDASRCSSVYGKSDTVQPAAYLAMYYIKAA